MFSGLWKKKEVLEGEATTDKTYCSENTFSGRTKTVKEFGRAVDKLFQVNQWSNLPGLTSSFILTDSNGKEKKGALPAVGDFIKIMLPGPTPENWVIITDINKQQKIAEFTVSPSQDPTERKDQGKVEHFFIKEATSTFKVEMYKNSIKACEIGRNEGINNNRNAGDRKLINTILAEGGWATFQKTQWKKLTDYLVHKIEVEPAQNSDQ